MKNLFIFLAAFSLFACKKIDHPIQQAVKHQNDKLSEIKEKPGYQLYMTHVVNYDTAMGVRSTFEVKNLGGNGATLKGVWLAAYISTESGARPWIQLGYHQWGGPSMFSMMFYSLVKGTSLGTWPVLAAGTTHSFHIRIGENGNVFTGVDGVDYSMFPLGATSIATKHVTFEAEGSVTKAPSMPTIRFFPALEVYQNGGWSPATNAFSSGSGYGVQATGINDVVMGSGIKTKPGIQLW